MLVSLFHRLLWRKLALVADGQRVFVGSLQTEIRVGSG